MVLGWFRDVACTAPQWPVRPVGNAVVSLKVKHRDWHVQFVNPVTGEAFARRRATATDGTLRLALPKFEGSVALKLVADRGEGGSSK